MTIEQLRLVGLLQRRAMVLMTALMLAVATLLALGWLGVLRFGATAHEELESLAGFGLLISGLLPLFVLAVVWPISAWRREPPSQRGATWTAPYHRAPQVLLRVLAGWFWMMVITAIYVALFGVVAVAGSPVELDITAIRNAAASAIIGVTILYLLVSMLAIRMERPGFWCAGLFVVLFLVPFLAAALESQPVPLLTRAGSDLITAVTMGLHRPALAATWTLIGAAGCIAAACIHQEGRR